MFTMRLGLIALLFLMLHVSGSAQNPDKDPLDRVMKELQAGRTENALTALDEAIKQHPNNAYAYLLRGSLRLMQNNPSLALPDFNKVIELKPDCGQAYNQRAFIRLTNNDVAGALQDLDAAIAQKLDNDGVYSMRGDLRLQTGNLKGALSDFDASIKLNPHNPRSYATRSQLLFELKERDRALADLNYLINWFETDPNSVRPTPKRDPPNSEAAKSEGCGSLGATKPSDFSVGIGQETPNEAPGDKDLATIIADAYVNRGYILSSRGNHESAFSDFNKALRINPKNVWALYDRAIEYERKGDLPAALADIAKAAQLEPDNGNVVVEHGVILLLMGKEKEAQAAIDVLLQLDRALWQKRIDDRLAAVRQLLPPK